MQGNQFENEKRMKNIRKKAKEAYKELEMPESIRTPGRTWTRYPKNIQDGIKNIENFNPEVSTEGDIDYYTGAEAAEKAGEKLLDSIKLEENKLNALHAANINSLIYIKARGNSKAHIKYDTDDFLFAHIVIETENNTDVRITEEFRGKNKLQTSFTEIYTGDNSRVNYGAIESLDAKLSYSHRKAIVGRDSTVKWLNGQFEGKLNRTKIETILKGDNSETEKIGVWYPINKQHFDISLHAYHIGTNTKCDMDSRAVSDDKSRSIYEGLQKVEKTASDTKSFQDQETLLLSDRAEADASPKLMIENPEVEASHAAASGNIQKDKKHYLESRGLTDEQAERLVVKGYFEPVMSKITLPDLKESIRKEVIKKIEREK